MGIERKHTEQTSFLESLACCLLIGYYYEKYLKFHIVHTLQATFLLAQALTFIPWWFVWKLFLTN